MMTEREFVASLLANPGLFPRATHRVKYLEFRSVEAADIDLFCRLHLCRFNALYNSCLPADAQKPVDTDDFSANALLFILTRHPSVSMRLFEKGVENFRVGVAEFEQKHSYSLRQRAFVEVMTRWVEQIKRMGKACDFAVKFVAQGILNRRAG